MCLHFNFAEFKKSLNQREGKAPPPRGSLKRPCPGQPFSCLRRAKLPLGNRSNSGTDSDRLGYVTERERRSLYDQRSYHCVLSIITMIRMSRFFFGTERRRIRTVGVLFFTHHEVVKSPLFTLLSSDRRKAAQIKEGVGAKERPPATIVQQAFFFICLSPGTSTSYPLLKKRILQSAAGTAFALAYRIQFQRQWCESYRVV